MFFVYQCSVDADGQRWNLSYRVRVHTRYVLNRSSPPHTAWAPCTCPSLVEPHAPRRFESHDCNTTWLHWVLIVNGSKHLTWCRPSPPQSHTDLHVHVAVAVHTLVTVFIFTYYFYYYCYYYYVCDHYMHLHHEGAEEFTGSHHPRYESVCFSPTRSRSQPRVVCVS